MLERTQIVLGKALSLAKKQLRVFTELLQEKEPPNPTFDEWLASFESQEDALKFCFERLALLEYACDRSYELFQILESRKDLNAYLQQKILETTQILETVNPVD